MITEVEAYNGERDRACHARFGRTSRSEVLYRAGGVWYVYLCYGVHEMLNLVVGPADRPAAVLIRSVEGITGPGRITRTLGIDRSLNQRPAIRVSGLHVENRGVRVPARLVQRTPRSGWTMPERFGPGNRGGSPLILEHYRHARLHFSHGE